MRQGTIKLDNGRMMKLTLTTSTCSDIVTHLLEQPGWSVARMAKVTDSSADYIERIQAKKQSFQLSDVEALAKACRRKPHMLLFESMRRERFKPQYRGLYDLAAQEVQRHEQFERALRAGARRKRRTSVKAA
jgi:hypothetical protein